MKKIFTVLIFLSLTIVGFGQLLAPNWIKVGKGGTAVTLSAAELKYIHGATSSIQAQLDLKATIDYVNTYLATGITWVPPVEDIVSTLANGILIDKRYILSTNNHINVSNGDNTWTDLGVTSVGVTAYVKADDNIPANYVGPYSFNGSAWAYMGTILGHNDLSGLQGGAANEYYHLTNAQHTVVANTLGVNTGDNAINNLYSGLVTFPGFGTSHSTSAYGDHAHGNITNTGAIGSTANLPVITTTSGALTTGSFGTGATNFTVGNDSRLSDARTPIAHNQAVSTISDATTVGQNFVKLTNPSAITFARINANNTVDALSASDFRTAIGAGTGGGNVTLTGIETLTNKTLTSPKINEDVALTVTSTYLNRVDATSSIQTQLNTKLGKSDSTSGSTAGKYPSGYRVSLIEADLNNSTILNVTGLDSLRVLPSEPVTGNIYINSIDKKIHYLSGGYWHRFAILDSVAAKATYYVSSQGDDSNNGLTPSTPWKTITKVNSYFSSINAGDKILFKSGDTFYGKITISKQGTAVNPITIGSYGLGKKPIITGLSTISSWTNEGGGIYSKIISCESKPNFILINGKQYAMGRFPNAGTNLIIDSHSTNVSVTDADLDSAVTNWTGAEVVIRKNEFVMDRCPITSHVSHTLSYTDTINVDNATDNYYYFIQNDLRTLDQFGEWYYSGTKLYVYFGSMVPTAYSVKIPTLNRLVYAFWFPFTIIDGIRFEGANYRMLEFQQTEGTIVKNCELDFSGGYGIYMFTASGIATISNNIINHTCLNGIFSQRTANITNNIIKNVGVIEGMGVAGSLNNGISIDSEGTNSLVQYNIIDSVDYDGIIFSGIGVSIRNNTISNFCLNLNDGGGIYTGGSFAGRIIDGNVVFNGIGKKGISSYTLLANGIYMDSYTNYTLVTNNSVYHCGGYGIMLSNGSYVTIKNNTCYDNASSMYFLEWGVSDVVNNIIMTDNIFFAKGVTDNTLYFDSQSGTIGSFGTSDRNYFARPIDDNTTIYTNEGGISSNVHRTLAGWKTYSGQDANSNKAPVTVSTTNDLHFIYNSTNSVQQYTLSTLMVDVANSGYYGTINVNPYTSLVLIGSGKVTFKPTKLIRQ